MVWHSFIQHLVDEARNDGGIGDFSQLSILYSVGWITRRVFFFFS